MLVHILKLIHLLCIIGLLGSTVYCLVLIGSKKFALANSHHDEKITRTNKALLAFSLLAILTGTLLVYPKHYTFHTQWIQAAYFLVTIFGVGVATLLWFRNTISRQHRGMWFLTYVVLISVLVMLIHDAVTKTTFVF